MRRFRQPFLVSVSLLIPLLVDLARLPANDGVSDAVRNAIQTIGKVGPEGEGAAEARHARAELARHGVELLPELIAAMDTPNVLAANWFRTVYDPLVERLLADPKTPWPMKELKEFVSDSRRQARVRAVVVELIEQFEPGFRESWILTRVNDNGFRVDAVAAVLAEAERDLKMKKNEQAKSKFELAFQQAREPSQVTQAARQLTALGVATDVRQHLGLIADWWLIGPFDAPGKTGFALSFPPEKQMDLSATYTGQNDQELRWIRHTPKDPLAQVNLIESLTNCREAVGYAYSEIDLPNPRKGELRCGADDNCSVWINGKKVFGRDQWLNGTRFDRFITPIELPAGKSTLLVKICQGPQHRDPEVSNNWSFQIRLCDEEGLGLPFRAALTEAPSK